MEVKSELHIRLNTNLLNAIHDGMTVHDKDGRFLFINDSAAKNFEIDPKEWIGRHVAELIPNSVVYRALTTGVPQVRKHSVYHGINYMVYAAPLYEEGQLVGAIATHKSDQEMQKMTEEYENLKKYVTYLQNRLQRSKELPFEFEHIILAENSPLTRILWKVQKASRTDIPILIRGESGVGKELLAKAIHDSSEKMGGPFVTVNCSAIPEALLESELFGYEEGAFTGAKRNGKKGKFELANGGSIFLDEIGDMNFHLQAKLLRVLQQKELVKVGGTDTVKLDIRIITATHRDLETMIVENTFREDLYYRINGVSFEIPPLRERKMDIEALIHHFTQEFSLKYGKTLKVREETLHFLMDHPFPGNVRELKHAIEYAFVMCESQEIKISDLPKNIIDQASRYESFTLPHRSRKETGAFSRHLGEFNSLDLVENIALLEQELIREALIRSGNNRSKAIQMLGVSRQAFYDRLKKYKQELINP